MAQPTVIESKAAVTTASRSPSLTFAAQPATDDVILMFPATTTTAPVMTIPSGWVNVFGGVLGVDGSGVHSVAAIYHRVTSAEAVSTKTYTATNLYASTATGDVAGCIVRGVHTTTTLAGFATSFATGTATPHVLPGLTPATTEGLAIAAVAKDGTGTYTTPTGWTQLITSNTNQGAWMGRYNTVATRTPIPATNITPSASDEYASITVVLTSVLAPVEARLARISERILTTGTPAAQLARINIRALTTLGITDGLLARISLRALVALLPTGVTAKVWNGTAFVDGPVKTWNGTAFVDDLGVKTWNGSAFV